MYLASIRIEKFSLFRCSETEKATRNLPKCTFQRKIQLFTLIETEVGLGRFVAEKLTLKKVLQSAPEHDKNEKKIKNFSGGKQPPIEEFSRAEGLEQTPLPYPPLSAPRFLSIRCSTA